MLAGRSLLTVPAVLACFVAVVAGCNQSPREVSASPATSTATPAAAASSPAATSPAALRLGRPIEPTATPARLLDIAKDPRKFEKGAYATTGRVTAVCQHRGCWMEIKDDASEAHIKMAGHAFFVPRSASGKKAKVLAEVQVTPEDMACGDHDEGTMGTAQSSAGGAKPEKKGCRAEAEEQLGHPLAKLELVALGVELYD